MFNTGQGIGRGALESFQGGPVHLAIRKGETHIDDTLSSIANRLSSLLDNPNVRLANLLEILGFTEEMLKNPVAGFYGGHFYGINTVYTAEEANDDEQEITERSVPFIPLKAVSLPVPFAEYQEQRTTFFADNALAHIQPGADLLADNLSTFNKRVKPDEFGGVEINEANLQAKLDGLRRKKDNLSSELEEEAKWLLAKNKLEQHRDEYDNERNNDYTTRIESMQRTEYLLDIECKRLNHNITNILCEIELVDTQICATEYAIACVHEGTVLTLQDLTQYQIPRILSAGIDRYPEALVLVWSMGLDALSEYLSQ